MMTRATDPSARAKIRLFVDQPLAEGNRVTLERPQAHYLFGVMRLAVGAQVALFNGHDGEWTCEIVEAGKRGGVLACQHLAAPQQSPPDLWLMFAPIKKARTDFIVEKAVELGAARICPVQTEFTNAERIRQDRLQAHVIEAAEQCGAAYVPQVTPLNKFAACLAQWPEDRHILFCDEAAAGAKMTLEDAAPGPWAIFIGPEGGFSERERNALLAHPQTTRLALGPRILRAETAAVAALTLWQSQLGDWT